MKIFRSHSIHLMIVLLLCLGFVYVLSSRPSSLQAQDAVFLETITSSPVVYSLPITSSNQGVAYDAKTNQIVATDYKNNVVKLVNLTTGASISVTVGTRPVAAAIYATSKNSYAYIGNEGSDNVSVIDLSTKSVIKTIPVGQSPVSIAINSSTGKGYVANFKSDKVSILTLSTNTVSATIAVGSEPASVAINTTPNKIYVANSKSDTVSVIDGKSSTVTATIPVGQSPVCVAVNSVKSMAYSVNSKGNSVSAINLSTNAVTATIPVGPGPESMAIDTSKNTGYVANLFSDSVSVLNLSTNAVTGTYAVGRDPIAVAFYSPYLIVATQRGDGLWVINTTTQAFGTAVPVGKDPDGIAVDPTTNRALTANEKSNDVSIVDLSSVQVIATIPAGGHPTAVAINSETQTALAANEKDDTLSVIDLTLKSVIGTIAVGKSPVGVAINPKLNIAAIANRKADSVSVVDLSTHSVTGTIAVGKSPSAVAIQPTGNIGVAANRKDNTVSILDLLNHAVIATIPVGKDPAGVAIDPDLNLAVVTNNKDNTASLIDLNSKAVVATVNVGKGPRGVGINPSTHRAAIANFIDGTITVIDLSSRQVVQTLSAGTSPAAVDINPNTNQASVTLDSLNLLTILQLNNSVPMISGFVPVSISAGNPAFTLTVQGSKFITNSVVNFNGQAMATQFVSATKLTASIPAPAITVAGTVPVTVTNPAPGGGTSDPYQFTIKYPIPVLTALSPNSITARSADFTLRVTGSQFVPGDVINFNGQNLLTTYISQSALSAIVPSSLVQAKGLFPVSVITADQQASNSLVFTVTDTYPVITGFSPTEGTTGTLVTIVGSNFNHAPTTISFNGSPATVSSLSDNEIKAVVPPGAKTGSITVKTSIGSTQSTVPFTVRLRQDFALNITPQNATIPANGSASFPISLTDMGIEPFTGLVKLSLQNSPAGITGSFNPQYVSFNRPSTLTLTSQQGNQATVTIQGNSSIEGSDLTKTVVITLNPQTPGATTLRGRILATKDASPIAGVTVKLGALTTITDGGGNFTIMNPPAGDQVIVLDGNTANHDGISYPSALPVAVAITAGVDNPLPAPIYLHEVKTSYFTQINPLIDTIVTDPEIPNYEMRIPAGAVITGWDGQPNTQVSVKPIPIDRLPIKSPPAGVYATEIYMYYFFKPGGGTPSQPIPVKMPNTFQAAPGTRAQLWYYDESFTPDPNSNQWKPFGMGTVSSDGRNIIPDPGVGIPKFCCGASFVTAPPSNLASPKGTCPSGVAEPVDPYTGAFMYTKNDIGYPSPSMLNIIRYYNSSNAIVGEFGSGTSINYNHYLQGSGNALTYIPPEGGNYIFSKNADGSYTNINYPFLRGAKAYLNADSTRTLNFKDGSAYTFDANGRVVEQTDSNGNWVMMTRDSFGNITGLNDSYGRKFYISNTTVMVNMAIYTLISSVMDMGGREVSYTYNSNAQLTSVTLPDGSTTNYSYDGSGRLVSIINARGITEVTNQYDGSGRVIGQTHAAGGVFNLAYNVVGGTVTQTAVTEPNGGTTTYRLNGAGYSSEITDAYGQKTTYTRAFSTNDLNSVTDPLGRTTTYIYDANGNTTSIIDPVGNVTRYEYDPVFNKPTKITDAIGNITTLTYDVKGNLIQILSPKSELTVIGYNAKGVPISLTDALGNISTFEYDEFGNLIKATDPLGNAAQLDYDFIGRLISAIDPKGKITLYSYDDLNRIREITDALNGKTIFSYDQNGNLLTVKDAKNQTITYTYNLKDKVATMTDQLGKTETYSYDQSDNLLSLTDRKGQTTAYQYDLMNLPTKATYSDGSTTSFTYDVVRRLTDINDSISGPIHYEYSNTGCSACGGAIDKVIQEITPLGSISYTYDAIGRRTSMTVAGQPTVNYNYDADSSLTNLNTLISGVVANFNIGHDALGRRASLTLPNGVTTNYGYDNASRLLNLNHLNPANAILESLTYTYDANSNRTSMVRPAVNLPMPNTATNITHNQANQLLTFNDKTITYGDNGNMTAVTNTCGTTNYTWDVRNKLTGMNGFNTDCSPLSASFKYDAWGRRFEKTVNGKTTQYLYDGYDIIQEIEGGAVSANYIRTGNIDEPLVRIKSDGSVKYYQTDALGSIIALTDETGVITTQYAYDPFGNVTVSGQVSDNPFQYTGRENDGTGLYYYRARYYNSELQRFISEDPIGLMGGINKFAYTFNNPANLTDPLGLDPLVVTINYWPSQYGSLTMVWNSWLPSFYTSGTIGSNGKIALPLIYTYQYGQHPMSPGPDQDPYPALNLYFLGSRDIPAFNLQTFTFTTISGLNVHAGNPIGSRKSGSKGCHVIPGQNWNSFMDNIPEGSSGLYINIWFIPFFPFVL